MALLNMEITTSDGQSCEAPNREPSSTVTRFIVAWRHVPDSRKASDWEAEEDFYNTRDDAEARLDQCAQKYLEGVIIPAELPA